MSEMPFEPSPAIPLIPRHSMTSPSTVQKNSLNGTGMGNDFATVKAMVEGVSITASPPEGLLVTGILSLITFSVKCDPSGLFDMPRTR